MGIEKQLIKIVHPYLTDLTHLIPATDTGGYTWLISLLSKNTETQRLRNLAQATRSAPSGGGRVCVCVYKYKYKYIYLIFKKCVCMCVCGACFSPKIDLNSVL